ncbi:MAG: RNA-binding S4 domain-containing protein [Candidatus Rokubacteria bacterium]|nr:RNA-binding S4 domain-containing protein [Candidatus Rokubacteria bacterium]
MAEVASTVRLDRWLTAARVFKSRTLAAEACDGGKVDVNDDAAKPARAVRPGDLLRITLPHGRRRILKVTALGERRGSAAVARTLFADLTPPEPPRVPRAAPIYRPQGSGRPTKRERREVVRLRGR